MSSPDERRAGELGALYRISSLGTTRASESEIVQEAARLAGEVVACDLPLVLLYEPENGRFQVYGSYGERDPIPAGEPSIVRRVFQSSRGEIVNDVFADPDSSPMIAEAMAARQVAAVPLESAAGPIGVLAAVNSKRGAFADNDLRVLTVLAERTAVAVENARLRSTLARQTQEIKGLQRISRLLAAADTVDYAIGESVRIVADLLGSRRMVVLLCDEEEDALVAHPPAVGFTGEELDDLKVSLAVPSLAATAFRTDTALMSNHARRDAWVGSELQAVMDASTLLAVPLSSTARPLGVLLAADARRGRFDDNDLRFTSLLGTRIGSVIESSRARERERALLQRLREADRTKTEFVSMLAHELNGPMTTIVGFGNVLRDEWETLPEDRRTRFLDIVSKETDRLSRLVQDLLDVSRMDAGTLRYELEPMTLPDLVDSILTVHPSIKANHAIEVDVPADLPKVLGDKDRIRQVFLNLLTNATRYSPDDTTIVLRAAEEGAAGERYVRVSVQDEGIGISAADRERIFSKFVMLPKPSWVKKGTGLGLFITKGIVEAHGGRIWVESEPGKGSTFHFTLRVAD
ncbi:MAG TPA: ATP-binding protein [Actinomycetota bacterium]|jgi:signal transduction histidine kinase|nr:ATP-binding protein [Actinomycetota bacterium]